MSREDGEPYIDENGMLVDPRQSGSGMVRSPSSNSGPGNMSQQNLMSYLDRMQQTGGRGSASGYDRSGRWVGTQDAGSRDVGNVNWGGVAGIQNYLQQLPPSQRQQASAQLVQQGMMPTVNGTPLDMNLFGGGNQNADSNTPTVNGGSSFDWGAYRQQLNGGGQQDRTSAMNPAAAMRPQSMFGGQGGPFAGVQNAFQPAQGFQLGGSQSRTSGKGGGFGAGGSPSIAGPMGLPLEGKAQGSIMGILNNPSPLNAEQTSIARNRYMGGLADEQAEASKNSQMDAVRRGVNPSENAGNQHAIEGQFRGARLQASNDFDIKNAMASREGLLGGLSAAGGLMNTQAANEDSVRKYLATLGMAQSGAPMSMFGGGSLWG